nr:hypothetical protein [Pedobacter panaciterrae]
MRKLFYIFISAIMLAGCSNKIDERVLSGKYHFNTYKLDVLNLYRDHTYQHQYVNTKGQVFECKGKWRYNGKEILFHDFNFFNDLGPVGGAGVWISRIVEEDEKIHLIYSSDDNTYFEKE